MARTGHREVDPVTGRVREREHRSAERPPGRSEHQRGVELAEKRDRLRVSPGRSVKGVTRRGDRPRRIQAARGYVTDHEQPARTHRKGVVEVPCQVVSGGGGVEPYGELEPRHGW